MDAMRRLILGPEGRVAGLLVATRACSQQRARADRLKPLHHVKVARHRRRWVFRVTSPSNEFRQKYFRRASVCPTSRLSPKTLVQAEDRYLPWRQKSLTRHTRVVVVWACSRLPHTTISLGCLRPLGPPAPLEKRTQQNFYVDSVLMDGARSFSAAKEWMQARSPGVWTLLI